MVQRGAEVLGAAAGAHVEAVRGEACPQGRQAEALHVNGVRGALQAVEHHDFTDRFARGTLRKDHHLDVGLGAVQAAFEREAGKLARAPPIVAGDGLEVRISEQRVEGLHGVEGLY